MTAADPLRQGLRAHAAGRLAEAQACYRQALELAPGDPEALHHLGLLAFQAGDHATAARLIGEALAARPDDAAAQVNLGNALAALQRLPEAQAALERGVALDPAQVDAWFNLGNVQRERGLHAAARASYERVLALAPTHGGALNNVANLLYLEGRAEEAALAFQALGDLLQGAGRTEKAAEAYRQALAASPHPSYKVALAFLLPALPGSVREIDAGRARLDANLDALRRGRLAIDEPLRFATSAIFYTGYHGRDDRELRRSFADFYLAAHPALACRAPHCAGYRGPSGPIRIGFASKFFAPEHPMSKLFGGIVDALDRARFDVRIFRLGPEGPMSFGARTPVAALGTDLAAARAALAAAQLDVLFYTDIGMEPLSYFLGCARLAPVQCVTFGHPVTTGLPTIDYFVSAQDMEPADADAHYVETLVRLSVVPTYFRAPVADPAPPTRAALGLPAAAGSTSARRT